MTLTEHIDAIGKDMLAILLAGMKKGKIPFTRSKEIARYYLGTIKKAQSEEELQNDLKELEVNLPEMKDAVALDAIRQREDKDREACEKAESLLKQGRIEEASITAKEAIT